MAQKKKLTIIMFSGDLDKVMAAFTLATTAASTGMDVTMFFTFWGLNVVRKDGGPKPKGLVRRMLGIMNKGGVRNLKLSKFHMMGMGTGMLKGLMKEAKMPTVEDMIKLAKQLGVKFIACTNTMGVYGLCEDNFIPEVDSCAGAATYLAEASEAQINLFI